MISLIFLLIFGSGVAFLSLQNTTLISLSLLNYSVKNIPLYYVIIGSMLIGIVSSYLINAVDSISHIFILRGKNNQIRSEAREMTEMTKRIHQLQLENAVLKKDNNPESEDKKSL